MHISALHTPIVEANDDLFALLDAAFPVLPERSVVVVTSKIISLCEGRVVPIGTVSKEALVAQEADKYISMGNSKYGVMLTVIRNQMFANAGIDESNSNGNYVLWPEDPQRSANEIWQHLRKKTGVKELGVIVSDSRVAPLYWGTLGAGIAHCGFRALNSKISVPDLFGRELKFTQVSVLQGVAAAAVLEMGESNEQTPLALVTEIKEITFQDREPTVEELDALKIEIEDDLYAPILTKAEWQTGKK